MQKMSGLDASFLYFETPSMHMHVCGTLLLDPSTSPEPWGVDEVRRTVAERLPFLPPFRRRIHVPTLRLNHPSWVDVDEVDLSYHIDAVSCPAPGDRAALADVVAEFASHQLDRRRPLWRIRVVEGLADGRAAAVVKVHHCAVDGPAAANVLGALFDLTPERRDPAELGREVAPPAPAYGLPRRVVRTTTDLATHPWNVVKLVPDTASAVTNIVRGRRGAAAQAPVPFTAPRAPWNGSISAERAVALVDVPLDDLKQVKDAVAGATFNDVVLAICGGALRRYLLAQDALPEASLLAVCPVSVRTDDGAGNQQSAMFAGLGTDVADPLERLHEVHGVTTAAKVEHEALGPTLIQQAAQVAPPPLATLGARAYSAVRLADLHPIPSNLVLSNLPGPPFQIYFAGASIEQVFPLGPVLEGFALNVTVASYHDRVGFGFIACRRRLPDLADLADEVVPALRELVEASGVRAAG